MRKRSRAAGADDVAPPRAPQQSEGAGFGLDSMFDHADEDTLGATTGGDLRSDRGGPGGRRLMVLAGVLAVVVAGGAALVVGTAAPDDDPSTAVSPVAGPDIGSPPAELPANGSAIRSRVTVNGDVVVNQWIRSRFPVTDLGIRTPPDEAGAVRVADVSVIADGASVAPVPDRADPTLRFVFGVPAQLVYVRYVLTRALETSSSVPGRALVESTFLRVDYSPRLGPTVVTVKAPAVLSLSCSKRQELLTTPRPCGAPVSGGWQVTLRDTDREDQVLAQVDLES